MVVAERLDPAREPVDAVVDVGEVEHLVAPAEDRDRLAAADPVLALTNQMDTRMPVVGRVWIRPEVDSVLFDTSNWRGTDVAAKTVVSDG